MCVCKLIIAYVNFRSIIQFLMIWEEHCLYAKYIILRLGNLNFTFIYKMPNIYFLYLYLTNCVQHKIATFIKSIALNFKFIEYNNLIIK